MKKYFSEENVTALVIVVIGGWIALATFGTVSSWIDKAKSKLPGSK